MLDTEETDAKLCKQLERDQIKYGDRCVEYRMSWCISRVLGVLYIAGFEKSWQNIKDLLDEYVKRTHKWEE